MQNISFKINYGNAVSTLPARAFDFIISGSATPNDIKTLLVACSLSPDNLSTSVLSEKTGMNPESVNRSLAFWEFLFQAIILPLSLHPKTRLPAFQALLLKTEIQKR